VAGLALVGLALGIIALTSVAGIVIQAGMPPSTSVVVAARDIPIRTGITAEDLKVAVVARRDVMPGSFTRLEDVSRGGYVAELSIVRGQPITSNMLVKQGDVVTGPLPAFLPIARGFVAVTIPTSERAGVAGYIQVGDYINVIVTMDPETLRPERGGLVNRTVFTNVHVIRTGSASGRVSGAGQSESSARANSVGAATLTVVVTQCDAEFLTWFESNGRLSYTLGSYLDYRPQDVTPDPACPNLGSARGIGPADVDRRWRLSDLAGGRVTVGPLLPGQTEEGG
jgi:pilus assembly protein CpaB